MPRGRKPRQITVTLPPRYYVSPLAALEAVRRGRISPTAAYLWDVIQAHAWQAGRCDLPDRELSAWLGGMSERQVINLRAMLVAAGLLREVTDAQGRWLIPLPGIDLQSISGEMDFSRNDVPAEAGRGGIDLQSISGEMDFSRNGPAEADRRGIDLQSISGEMDFSRNGPTDADREGIDLQSISGEMDFSRNGQEEEEEVNINPGDHKSPPPEKGGPGGKISLNSISGEIHFSRNGVQVNSATSRETVPSAELAHFLVVRGVFPATATGLAISLLGRMSPAEARVYALAQLRAVQVSSDRGRRLAEEQVIGRWVARLRQGAEPPAWALAQAQQELAFDAVATPAAEEDEDAAVGEDADAAADPAAESGRDGEPPSPAESSAQGSATDAAALWQTALAHLQYQMPRSVYTANLIGSRGLGLEQAADGAPTLVVQVTGAPAAAWLNMHFKPMILRTLHGLAGREYAVRFVTEEHV